MCLCDCSSFAPHSQHSPTIPKDGLYHSVYQVRENWLLQIEVHFTTPRTDSLVLSDYFVRLWACFNPCHVSLLSLTFLSVDRLINVSLWDGCFYGLSGLFKAAVFFYLVCILLGSPSGPSPLCLLKVNLTWHLSSSWVAQRKIKEIIQTHTHTHTNPLDSLSSSVQGDIIYLFFKKQKDYISRRSGCSPKMWIRENLQKFKQLNFLIVWLLREQL